MTRFEKVFWTLWLILALTMFAVKAQEKNAAYHQTQQWMITEWTSYTRARLDVVDTAGVCLYVLRGYAHDDVALAAVPKTQLPQDTGCQ